MNYQILTGDVLEQLATLPDESVQCCVTSPPYWGLRDYGHEGQIGQERTPELYVEKMVQVFREVRRVLKSDGVLWLNLGDSFYNYRPGYEAQSRQSFAKSDGAVVSVSAKRGEKLAGLKEKDLIGIPWRVAFAMQADGWWLRQDIIWSKPNPMPESVQDRCTKAHEYIFLLTKSARYYYDNDAVRQPHTRDWQTEGWAQEGKRDDLKPVSSLKSKHGGDKTLAECYNPAGANRKSVWNITTKGFSGAHFATFPPEIPEICIKAGSKEGDTILDPFAGSGTTLEVALRLGRNAIGIELNPKYVNDFIIPRCELVDPLFRLSTDTVGRK